jgi:DNA topoisomerase II
LRASPLGHLPYVTRCRPRADEEDGESIELAFSKKKVEQRKQWLREFVPGTFLDHTADEISYRDFVHRELILFSRADLERSIPSMLDGLKPGQRKILYSCFKRNLKSDVKVRARRCPRPLGLAAASD